jgi:hypothetical protein
MESMFRLNHSFINLKTVLRFLSRCIKLNSFTITLVSSANNTRLNRSHDEKGSTSGTVSISPPLGGEKEDRPLDLQCVSVWGPLP